MSTLVLVFRLMLFSWRLYLPCIALATIRYCVLPVPLGLATQWFFDTLSGERAGLNVWSALAFFVGVQLAEVLAEPALGYFARASQYRSHVLLRRNLFDSILRGYGRHGLLESASEIISRFRDDPEHIADATDAICDLIGRTLFAVVAAVVMWRVDPLMTGLLLVPILLTAYVTEVLGTRTLLYRAAARQASGRLTAFLGDVLAQHLAVSVAGAAPHAVRRLSELGETRRRFAVRDSVFDTLVNALAANLSHLGTGVVLLVAAHAIRDGSFTVGDFALFVMYLDQLGWYPLEISRLISDLKHVQVSFERMQAVVPYQPRAALVAPAPLYLDHVLPELAAAPKRTPLEQLEVRGLTYAYPHGGGIVDISFTLARGSFTVITGSIGSGKSSLLLALLGLLPRDSGEILWNRQPIDDPATFFVPPRSAFTPQVPRLFSASVRENILLGLDCDSHALQRAVHAAVLEPDLSTLERGLDTLVGPRGVKLSGGQVQRVAAARMFVRAAELLVFDDLSSALDAETEAELWTRLFARGRDVTCLVVSHRPGALRRADQVLTLEAGRLVTLESSGGQHAQASNGLAGHRRYGHDVM